jgi:hypothetical protein
MRNHATLCGYCGSPEFLMGECLGWVRLFCRACGSRFEGQHTQRGLEGQWHPGPGWIVPPVRLN